MYVCKILYTAGISLYVGEYINKFICMYVFCIKTWLCLLKIVSNQREGRSQSYHPSVPPLSDPRSHHVSPPPSSSTTRSLLLFSNAAETEPTTPASSSSVRIRSEVGATGTRHNILHYIISDKNTSGRKQEFYTHIIRSNLLVLYAFILKSNRVELHKYIIIIITSSSSSTNCMHTKQSRRSVPRVRTSHIIINIIHTYIQ